MLTNEEKLMLIDRIVADAIEYTISGEKSAGFYEGILIAVCAVVNEGAE